MRRAISPRLAMRTLRNTLALEGEQRLAVFDGLSVGYVNGRDAAGSAGTDAIADAQGFDECQVAVFVDRLPLEYRRTQEPDDSDHIGDDRFGRLGAPIGRGSGLAS